LSSVFWEQVCGAKRSVSLNSVHQWSGCFLSCHPIQWKKALPAYHDQFLVAPINHVSISIIFHLFHAPQPLISFFMHLWRNWLAPSKHESKFDRSLQFVRFSIIWKYFQTFPNKDHVLFSDYFWLLLGCHQTKISRSFYCSNFHALLVILQSTNALLTLNFSARSIHHTWFAHCFDLQINHSNLVIWWLAPFKSITMLHSTCTTWNPSKTMLNFSRKIINFEHFGQNHAQISAKIST